jgi:hypothetical protein
VHSPILAPVVALVAWSMVMWAWMYITRIPAVRAAHMRLDPNAPRGEQMNQLPPNVRWKADNYNHLMEQPTLFYAIALALALMEQGGGFNLTLAWIYVGLRVLHSVIQATWNKIEVRFVVFFVSSVPLIALTFNAATHVIR